MDAKIAFIFFNIHLGFISGQDSEEMGPVFIYEPPLNVDFINTIGSVIDCSAHGLPDPKVSWYRGAERVEEIKDVLIFPNNGSLLFLPFTNDEYRQRIHAGVYHCHASNIHGTIVSRPVNVRAVVSQSYEAQVYDEYVITGNTAVFSCHIPSFVTDYVSVNSWVRDDSYTIRKDRRHRYSLLSDGKLHIRNAQNSDLKHTFWCKTIHRLTGETVMSASSGRLYISESESSVAPRFTHTLQKIVAKIGETVELAGAAQGHPVPTYTWYKLEGSKKRTVRFDNRVLQLSGSLILNEAKTSDSGIYVCYANNTVGHSSARTNLVVTEPLTVFISPQRQVVDVGRTVHLNCSINGNPLGNYQWMKDGNVIKNVVNRDNEKSNSYVIEHFQRTDKGMYQCFVDNHHQVQQGTAQLLIGDVAPLLTKVFENVTIQPGPAVSFECAANGNPKPRIKWFKNKEPIRLDYKTKAYESFTKEGSVLGTLNITDLMSPDGGQYACMAENAVGKVYHTGRLNVYGKPIVTPMQNHSVVAGSHLILDCFFYGYPIEKIKWSKDSYELKRDSKYEIFSNGSILIRNIDKISDSGRYTCSARNRMLHTSSQSTWIQVIEKPIIGPLALPARAKETAKIRIFCSVVAGDPPFSFQWYKDGRKLSLHLGIIEKKEDAYSSIEIQSLSTIHSGMYSCNVTNIGGMTSSSAMLNVEAAPYWKKRPVNTVAVKNHDAMIHCLADGFPKPKVFWNKIRGVTKQAISSADSDFIVHKNGSLEIRNVTDGKIGLISCSARNGVKPELRKEVYLSMGTPPQVEIHTPLRSMRLTEKFTLKCFLRGKNVLAVQWELKNKDNFPLVSNKRLSIEHKFGPSSATSLLTIKEVMKSDGGTYRCIGINFFGKGSKEISLITQEPPGVVRNITLMSYHNKTLKLFWQPPLDDGNSNIIQYEIHYKLAEDDWENVIKKIQVTNNRASLIGLKPGNTFEIRITCKNTIGYGKFSKAIRFMPTLNGTLIIRQASRERPEETTFDHILFLIIPAVVVIILFIILAAIIVTFCRKRNPNHSEIYKNGPIKRSQSQSVGHTDGSKYDYGNIYSANSDQVPPNTNYSNVPRYSTTRSSSQYEEIGISPYATFKLPELNQNEGSSQNKQMELRTFTPSKSTITLM